MGHLITMVSARNALDRLSTEKNGADGTKIYMYGEGWDFGEVAHNGRGINASQLNLTQTGVVRQKKQVDPTVETTKRMMISLKDWRQRKASDSYDK